MGLIYCSFCLSLFSLPIVEVKYSSFRENAFYMTPIIYLSTFVPQHVVLSNPVKCHRLPIVTPNVCCGTGALQRGPLLPGWCPAGSAPVDCYT